MISGATVKSIDGVHTNALIVYYEKSGIVERIPADAVLISTGAELKTSELIPSHLLNTDGSVSVDSFMRTSNADIYAAGDIASFPNSITLSSHRVEHWTVAQEQGMIAAMNMLGKGAPYDKVPFFWTN